MALDLLQSKNAVAQVILLSYSLPLVNITLVSLSCSISEQSQLFLSPPSFLRSFLPLLPHFITNIAPFFLLFRSLLNLCCLTSSIPTAFYSLSPFAFSDVLLSFLTFPFLLKPTLPSLIYYYTRFLVAINHFLLNVTTLYQTVWAHELFMNTHRRSSVVIVVVVVTDT